MSSYAVARAELVTALEAGGVKVDRTAAPLALIFGEGFPDLRGIGRGQVPAQYRIVLLAGKADDRAAAGALATLLGTAIAIVRALAGWQLIAVRPDRRRVIGTNDYLSADLIVSAMVDI